MKTRTLPQGAKTKQMTTDYKTGEKKLEVLTFNKMDGMYGQRLTEDGEIVIFNADFKKVGDMYEIVGEPE